MAHAVYPPSPHAPGGRAGRAPGCALDGGRAALAGRRAQIVGADHDHHDARLRPAVQLPVLQAPLQVRRLVSCACSRAGMQASLSASRSQEGGPQGCKLLDPSLYPSSGAATGPWHASASETCGGSLHACIRKGPGE